MGHRRAAVCVLAVVIGVGILPATAASGGVSSITADDLKEWLTYIASDELEGRETYSAGLGLAAGYIQEHLRAWGVKPAGDREGYLQIVRVLGVRTTSHSSVTVRIGRDERTFKDGEGVSFPRASGVRRTVTVDRVEFAGYGLDAPGVGHMDFRGKDVKGAAVVWLGTSGPKTVDAAVYRRLLTGRNRYAMDQRQAAASISAEAPAPDGGHGGEANGQDPAAGGRGRAPAAPDFTTAQRLDLPVPPSITASDAFLSFLFSRAPASYEDLKRRAAARDDLPSFRLDGVTITFNVDATYEIVRTQRTQNVVAVVEGSDPRLKHTYVAFGAHYDHVGYADGDTGAGAHRSPGRITMGAENDRIWNGADDDGSGTVALMALARAFEEGPRPKRSLLFVWHAGEERGLLGSRYFADYPTVPIDGIVAELNMDMIGRNRDDKPGEANTVYVVGSDRISSELHEINREANRALVSPMTIDYEMNDPADLEQVYYRSDHYSYAAKGIPIVFFTTGLHPDYHANTDEVSKIEFGKLARITQLAYETGVRVANLDHPPARDNRGPRAGKGTR
jgi:hypothetical protein